MAAEDWQAAQRVGAEEDQRRPVEGSGQQDQQNEVDRPLPPEGAQRKQAQGDGKGLPESRHGEGHAPQRHIEEKALKHQFGAVVDENTGAYHRDQGFGKDDDLRILADAGQQLVE